MKHTKVMAVTTAREENLRTLIALKGAVEHEIHRTKVHLGILTTGDTDLSDEVALAYECQRFLNATKDRGEVVRLIRTADKLCDKYGL